MRHALLVFLCFCGFACSGDIADKTVTDNSAVNGGPADAGQVAYEAFCASCHDTGLDGAPVTGNPDEWDQRSTLWQAVLFEHAKDGYLDMPAKGGMPELSDATAAAAAEYILEATFQDLPAD